MTTGRRRASVSGPGQGGPTPMALARGGGEAAGLEPVGPRHRDHGDVAFRWLWWPAAELPHSCGEGFQFAPGLGDARGSEILGQHGVAGIDGAGRGPGRLSRVLGLDGEP
jgi:hypothetical protein